MSDQDPDPGLTGALLILANFERLSVLRRLAEESPAITKGQAFEEAREGYVARIRSADLSIQLDAIGRAEEAMFRGIPVLQLGLSSSGEDGRTFERWRIRILSAFKGLVRAPDGQLLIDVLARFDEQVATDLTDLPLESLAIYIASLLGAMPPSEEGGSA